MGGEEERSGQAYIQPTVRHCMVERAANGGGATGHRAARVGWTGAAASFSDVWVSGGSSSTTSSSVGRAELGRWGWEPSRAATRGRRARASSSHSSEKLPPLCFPPARVHQPPRIESPRGRAEVRARACSCGRQPGTSSSETAGENSRRARQRVRAQLVWSGRMISIFRPPARTVRQNHESIWL